jgi:tRNA pseudouridine38-40 synthase
MTMSKGLRRTAMIVEYDGSEFVGLQRQDDGASIQGEFESVARILGVSESEAAFRASGRTDAGVHARGQVIVLSLPDSIAEQNVASALNWHLPVSIRVRRAVTCGEDFDPRRDARMRSYRYLLCGGQPIPALMRHHMGHIASRLDLAAMREAATALCGEHDFRAWRSAQCQAKRTVLNLEVVEVRPWSDAAPHGRDTQVFEMVFECRSFLHRMVRFLVGGIARVGAGKLGIEELKESLAEGTLPPRVAPAAACGLSLERVDYAPGRDPFQ